MSIEISYQTNPYSNIIQIVACYMPAIDLLPPAIANLNLSISGESPVTYNKVVSKSILHPAHSPMISIKSTSVTSPSSAIVNNEILPSVSPYRYPINSSAYSGR
jgi:hypothetical protein